MKLSIGIPVYNQASTLADAIRSVLSQDLPPFEIVVSENHSTDGTRGIVESFGDRVRMVLPPKHLSMMENWDFCVSSCKGDYIGLLSGDDQLLPNYTTAMRKAAEKHPSAVFLMGGWNVHDHIHNKTTPHYILSLPEATPPLRMTTALLNGPKASFASFCFQKSAYEQIGGYDKSYHLNGDWTFQFDMAGIGDFINIPEIIAVYHIAERTEMSLQRRPLYFEDVVRFITDKLPEAARRGVPEQKIKSARRNLLLRLMQFKRENPFDLPAEKAEVFAALIRSAGIDEHRAAPPHVLVSLIKQIIQKTRALCPSPVQRLAGKIRR
jgi:glycosyltransferase involved in cell wall biosynthesis